MPTEDAFRFLDQASELTDAVYWHLQGEPLLHPDFRMITQYAHKLGLILKLTSLVKTSLSVLKKNKRPKRRESRMKLRLFKTNLTNLMKIQFLFVMQLSTMLQSKV